MDFAYLTYFQKDMIITKIINKREDRSHYKVDKM